MWNVHMLILRVYGEVFLCTNGRLIHMNKSEQKQVLRGTLSEKRASLSDTEAQKASDKVCARLATYLGGLKGRSIHAYSAKANWREIDLAPYLEGLKDQHKDITIDVATHMAVQAIPKRQYDIVLVPMLAFDGNLQRLGMGMGWYDMFLSRQQHALKIGIAYDWAELEAPIAAEDHDVAMDVIVTPSRVITL